MQKKERPLILITNDDGFSAKGIHELAKFVSPLGEIIIVAPDGPRSGQSCAITVGNPMRIIPKENKNGYKIYTTNGTPVDCVKMSMNIVLDRKPDLLLSGINHGSNSAASVIYSGTMGAVFEGCMLGVPSIGFSLCSHKPDADFSVCESVVTEICNKVLRKGLPAGTGLNVNIPVVGSLSGIKVCRAARGHWTEEYDKRTDPAGHNYYWLTGHFHNMEPECEDTDEYLLSQGIATVVPVLGDRTGFHQIGMIDSLLHD